MAWISTVRALTALRERARVASADGAPLALLGSHPTGT